MYKNNSALTFHLDRGIYAWKAVSLVKLHLFHLGDYVLSYFKDIEEYVIVILFSIPSKLQTNLRLRYLSVKIVLWYDEM